MSSPDTPACNPGPTWAFLLLRLWIGSRTLLSGIEKFSEKITVTEPLRDANGVPDSSGAVVEISRKVYGISHYRGVAESLQTKFAQEPLLPPFLTTPFYAVLGYALVALGVMLLVGLWTRLSLVLTGVLYTVLTLGLLLIRQEDGVAWLAIQVGLIAYALTLAGHNRFALTRRC
jgi:thiosulfate dehydrogenase (quinone) large subunit